jgi:uncharacterized membrane protein
MTDTTNPVGDPNAVLAPHSSSEFITLISHFHRAEIDRMGDWRARIDLTTNWAITVVGAMLSLSLSAPSAHHGVILLAMLLVTLLLMIEARRYRFFDVYRSRVRWLERCWYAPIFAAEPLQDREWLRSLSKDLRHPQFLISVFEAISRRLRRTYGPIYLILLLAWLLKTTALNPSAIPRGRLVASLNGWLHNAALGPVPGLAIVAVVALFYTWLLLMVLRRYPPRGEYAPDAVHV